jgi:hypothetical protein
MTNHEVHISGGSDHVGHGDKPDVHGMAIVGEETVFLSHLPMFSHRHHDFQVILEATFTDDGTAPEKEPETEYISGRKKTKQTLYTFAPSPFRLPDLVSPVPQRPRRRAFTGTIVRGHFERGGEPLLNALTNVQRVLHFRQFDPKAHPLNQLEYILFGRGNEAFLAHWITRPPDFDQLLSVSPLKKLTDEELAQGFRVAFPGRANTVEERLKTSEEVVGKILLAGQAGTESKELQFRVGGELYFEEGELSS